MTKTPVILSPPKLSIPLAELHPDAAVVFKNPYLAELPYLPPIQSEVDQQRALAEKLQQFAAYRSRFGLALPLDCCTLVGQAALIPSLFQRGQDFRFGQVDADLDESRSRVEARS